VWRGFRMARNSAYHSQSSLRRRRIILQLQQERDHLPTETADCETESAVLNESLVSLPLTVGSSGDVDPIVAEFRQQFDERPVQSVPVAPVAAESVSLKAAPPARKVASESAKETDQPVSGSAKPPVVSIGTVPSTVPGLLRLMK